MIPAKRARLASSIPRCAARFSLAALRLGVNRLGHVGEQQHVSGEPARLPLAGRPPRNGRRLHTQQPPVAGGGDEVRPLALFALELSLHRLHRMQDQAAIDDPEHRATETKERSIAAAEDPLRRGVVE